MKIKSGYILRKIAGQNTVVTVGKAADEFSGLIQLSESGAFVWNCLTEGLSEEELIRKLQERYTDLDESTAKADLTAFIEKIRFALE